MSVDMTQNVQPPETVKAVFQAKATHRAFIARCFGVIYAHSKLHRQGDGHTHSRYAPACLDPHEVPLFGWPAIEMRREWLDCLETPGDGLDNVLELRRA